MPNPGIYTGGVDRNYTTSGYDLDGSILLGCTGKTPVAIHTYHIKYYPCLHVTYSYHKIMHNHGSQDTVDAYNDIQPRELMGTPSGGIYGANTNISESGVSQTITIDFAARFSILHPDDPYSATQPYATYDLLGCAYYWGEEVEMWHDASPPVRDFLSNEFVESPATDLP